MGLISRVSSRTYRLKMRLSGFLLLISAFITQTLAGGGAPPPPTADSSSNLDSSKPIHQNLIEQFRNETTKSPQDYNNNNSKESELMSKLGSITDAHSPTYNQDNPFPR